MELYHQVEVSYETDNGTIDPPTFEEVEKFVSLLGCRLALDEELVNIGLEPEDVLHEEGEYVMIVPEGWDVGEGVFYQTIGDKKLEMTIMFYDGR